VLIEQSVIGWKEYEMEVMRDRNDNVVIICSIENIDAMGVHTGDSITVAPIQTLTDKEYQRMRDASIAVIRAVGVETGGSNIQFGINPENGDMIVVEMNPRVSRSSASRPRPPATRSQARRQARGRVHAGRAAERHHEHPQAGGPAGGGRGGGRRRGGAEQKGQNPTSVASARGRSTSSTRRPASSRRSTTA
jgi:hypothetical protein